MEQLGTWNRYAFGFQKAVEGDPDLKSIKIVSVPGVQGGKPCLEGTRCPARNVGAIAVEVSLEEAHRTYSHLTRAQVIACRDWYRETCE